MNFTLQVGARFLVLEKASVPAALGAPDQSMWLVRATDGRKGYAPAEKLVPDRGGLLN